MSDSAKVPQTFSYYDKDGEWKFRKITLMGVVKSFVSQLKPGQDLTRVSLPAVLLHPYSMLEIFGIREMLAFEALLPINKENNPLERMLFVLRWLFATIQQENFHKKPYNPILGELHHCWSESNEHGKTSFMGEQVSHHPPIAAMYVNNEKEGISNTCNVSFGVRFGGNHVSIVTEGNAVLNISKFKEQYEIAKRTPDMIVKNVIFGTKKIYWSGDVSLSCPKHGYSVSLTFKESGSDNVVNGSLTQLKDDGEEEIFKIKGKCGGEIWLHSQKEKRLLIDIGAFLNKKPEIHYDSPKDIDPLDSLSVWADVNKYIVDNDMDLADEAKKKIEQDQRDRINQKKSSGVQHSPKYFQESDLGWVWKKSNDNNSSKKKKSAFDSDDSDDSSSSEDTVPQVVKNKTEVSDEDREGVQLREPLKKSSNRDSARFSRSPSHSQQDKESMSDSALSAKNRLKQVSKRNSFDSKEVLEKRALTDPKPQKYLPTPNVDYSSSGEVNIIKGWMKMRNSMKLWMNRFFVLRPGKLIYFKDEKDMLRDRCVGILRLADCKVKERTSNKDGCSFKIYHLLHYPIYHKYGLRGETLKMAMIPVSWNYCILRVSTEQDRRTWMSHIIHQIEYANSMEGSVHLNKSLDAIETISPPSDDEATSDQAVSEQEAPQDVVTSQEAAEDMFKIGTPEEDQKTAVEGLALQQKVAIKGLQKKTRKMLEEWKQELEVRMNSMEKRIQANINKKNTADAHSKQLVLSYWQLALILVAWFFISRLF